MFLACDSVFVIHIFGPDPDSFPVFTWALAIFQFMEKRGPGIHHMCYRVDDVKAKQTELEKQNMKFIYPEAKKGANNCLVNFIHPKSAGGVLIEISEKIK